MRRIGYMRSRWLLLAFLCVVASLLVPGIASASTAAGAETRVGRFDLQDQACVGVERSLSLGLHRGCEPTYDELASDSLLAAREIGLGVKNTATAVRSASKAYKGTTILGHALSKHAGRNPNIWGEVTGNQTTWHGQALQHFRDILRGPGSFQRVTNAKGTTFLEKMLPDGRGVRLQLDYRFKGFID